MEMEKRVVKRRRRRKLENEKELSFKEKSDMRLRERIIDSRPFKSIINLDERILPVSSEQAYKESTLLMRDLLLDCLDFDFKTVFINEDSVMKRIKKSKQRDLIKNYKPCLGIFPTVDYTFNNNDVDLLVRGNKTQVINKNVENAFFSDRCNNRYIGMKTVSFKMDFDIRIKLSTRMEQMECYSKIKTQLREGLTNNLYVKSKFLLPTEMCGSLYEKYFNSKYDFTNKENVERVYTLLNTFSENPILMELNGASGNYDLYLDIHELFYHLDFRDKCSLNDGELDGQVYDNFEITFNISLTTFRPDFFYIYLYKEAIHEYHSDGEVNTGITTIVTEMPPTYNNKQLYRDGYEDNISGKTVEFKLSKMLQELKIDDLVIGIIEDMNNRKQIVDDLFELVVMSSTGKYLLNEVDYDNDKFIVYNTYNDITLYVGAYVNKYELNQRLVEKK